mmetsp:Transcript_45597/g.130090  ORF Transcript_45597/g.130090 Transcript_45597/m.130090 type:complete len:743 (-) Transcript_45597:376-2604(-)
MQSHCRQPPHRCASPVPSAICGKLEPVASAQPLCVYGRSPVPTLLAIVPCAVRAAVLPGAEHAGGGSPNVRAVSPLATRAVARRWSPEPPCNTTAGRQRQPVQLPGCGVVSLRATRTQGLTAMSPAASATALGNARARSDSPHSPASSSKRLAHQLRELQAAKDLAAAQSAANNEQIAARQDSLRRETIQALHGTPRRLAETLKWWPSPRTQEQAAPSACAPSAACVALQPPAASGAVADLRPPGSSVATAPGPEPAADRAEAPGDAALAAWPPGGASRNTQVPWSASVAVVPSSCGQPAELGHRDHQDMPPNCAVAARLAFGVGQSQRAHSEPSRTVVEEFSDVIVVSADDGPASVDGFPPTEGSRRLSRSSPRATSSSLEASSSRKVGAAWSRMGPEYHPRPSSPRASSPPPRASGQRRPGVPHSSALLPPVGGHDADLERCREELARCAKALTPQHLRELRGLTRQSGAVAGVLETVAIFLGAADARPQALRRVLQGNVAERLRSFNPEGVTLGQFRRLQGLLASAADEPLGVAGAAVLLAWCRALAALLVRTGFRGAGGAASDGSQAALSASRGASTPQELQEPQPQPEPAAEVAERRRSPRERRPREGGLVVTPDLAALSVAERRQVRDLQVSKPGVSSIVFHGFTDCTDLDIPSLVNLEMGEVRVYPGLKPPVGQGLNKRATVTMHGCWPPNGRIKDASFQERYRQKIKQMTEEKHATFLDYDSSTGMWVFQVEHF